MAFDESVIEALEKELSGKIAQHYTHEISRFHRSKGSAEFHEAAEYIRRQLEYFGLESCVVERYPIDGEKKYMTWCPPAAWDPKDARLTMISPRTEVLCDFKEEPVCLVFMSSATPGGGISAEVADVGQGTDESDYEHREPVKGKIVLASGQISRVYDLAIKKYGAIGILSDYMRSECPEIGRTRIDLPDLVNYMSLSIHPWDQGRGSVRKDEGQREGEHGRGVFAFSLSARKADRLRRILANEKVQVKAEISVSMGQGYMDVVTGILPGTDPAGQETLVIAHLCHPRPGANDNASGCGLGMEIARTISTLVAHEAIPGPRRSIRFLFVPEMYGTVAYIDAHPEWPKSVVAGVNLDMVGEDQKSTGSSFIVTSTPWSCPSAVNDIAAYYTHRFFNRKMGFDPASPIPIRRYSISGYAGGSDHYILVDPTVGIPTVFLGHWPDRFYHSSMDTIDKTDPEEFRLVGLVAASYILDIASFDKNRAKFALSLVEAGARARLWSVAQAAMAHMAGGPVMGAHTPRWQMTAECSDGRGEIARLDFLVECEEAAMRSILGLVSGKTGSVESMSGDAAPAKVALGDAVSRKAAPGETAPGEAALSHATIKAVAPGGEAAGAGMARVNASELEYDIARACESFRREAEYVKGKLRWAAGSDARGAGDVSAPLPEQQSTGLQTVPVRGFQAPLDMGSFLRQIGPERAEFYRTKDKDDSAFSSKLFEFVNLMDSKRTVSEIVRRVSAEFGEFKESDAIRFLEDLESLGLVSLFPQRNSRPTAGSDQSSLVF
ncbi:MAG TPA: DUF4910 domain-containing protein [Firmicutes bacterium]|nr:DUF4910 domain-containing protein [Bacillota bacterium]